MNIFLYFKNNMKDGFIFQKTSEKFKNWIDLEL